MTSHQTPIKPVSVAQLKAWSRCQKQYAYQVVQGLAWPTPVAQFELGRSVHQLLDYQAKGISVAPVLPACSDEIRQLYALLAESRWGQLPVVASEWAFTCPFEQDVLIGRMDRVVQDGAVIRILDWKTGTAIPKLPEQDWQTRMYLYAGVEAQAQLGLTVPPAQWRMTYVQASDKGLTTADVPYSAEAHAQTQADLRAILAAIHQAEDYVLPQACPDRYCAYRAICGIEAQASATRIAGDSPLTLE